MSRASTQRGSWRQLSCLEIRVSDCIRVLYFCWGGGGLILSRNTRSQAQNALDDSSPMIG